MKGRTGASAYEFKAPWARSLWVITVLSSLLLAALPIVGFSITRAHPSDGLRLAILIPPLAILVGAALFTVRGYRLQGEDLLIRRLFWYSAVSLRGLTLARWDPTALRWAWRVCGNGGLFSFSGWYRNRKLGSYRMWVTDPRRAVILVAGGRTFVVSPDAPERLIQLLGFGPTSSVESATEYGS